MTHQHHQHGTDDRWAWKAAGLIAAGGAAVLGGLILSIVEGAPNSVPLAGAVLMVLCYGAAGVLAFRNA